MITSKTYYAQAGLDYIQSPDLVFATIYVVKRSGIQHDKYISGNPNRTYAPEPSLGKISFPTLFASGETVFVIFKNPTFVEPVIPPGVCEPVSINSITLPNMITGKPYNRTMTLNGTAPFVLNVTGAVPGITVTQSDGTVTIAGTPVGTGTFTLSFTVTNCSGSSDSFSQSITISGLVNNMTILNVAGGNTITNVYGISFVISTGSIPLGIGTVTAIHPGYNGVISVSINRASVFPVNLNLRVNGTLQQSIPVPASGNYHFTSDNFSSSDQLVIELTTEHEG